MYCRSFLCYPSCLSSCLRCDCYCFEVDECGGIQESFGRVQQISYVFMLTCWLLFSFVTCVGESFNLSNQTNFEDDAQVLLCSRVLRNYFDYYSSHIPTRHFQHTRR